MEASMKISRRQAMRVSGTTLAGLSIGLRPETLMARAQQAQPPVPDKLADTVVRNIAPLPLLPDGSAPEHAASEVGTIDRKSTRLNSSHIQKSRMPSSA